MEGPALHPLQISAGRFCFALIAITVVAAWMRPAFTRVSWPLHGGRSLCGWLGVTCTFAAAAHYTGDGPCSVAIGDLDGDHVPDLAVANFDTDIDA